MKQIVITLDSSDILSLEKQEDKECLAKILDLGNYWHLISLTVIDLRDNDCLGLLLKTLRSKLQRGSCKSDPRIRVLIQIDEVVGLDYSHNKIFERSFFELAINCASVICCRYSLKQKLV